MKIYLTLVENIKDIKGISLLVGKNDCVIYVSVKFINRLFYVLQLELVTFAIQVPLFTNRYFYCLCFQLQPHQVRHESELTMMKRIRTKWVNKKKRCDSVVMKSCDFAVN